MEGRKREISNIKREMWRGGGGEGGVFILHELVVRRTVFLSPGERGGGRTQPSGEGPDDKKNVEREPST